MNEVSMLHHYDGSTQHWLHSIARSAAVARYHTEATVAKQSVGEHTYGVFWLAHWMLEGIMGMPLALAIMAHDFEEHVTGDLPGPTKDRPGFREAVAGLERSVRNELGMLELATTPEEDHILKVADLLEGFLWCTREFQRGNRHIAPCRQNYRDALRMKLRDTDEQYRHKNWHVRANEAWKILTVEARQ
jgi:5'-deoxynucleotidase YfbR-like HD superfamily hydrolase